MSSSQIRRVLLGLTIAAVASLPAFAGTKAPKVGLASAGLAGSKASMQPVNLPARVSRIAHVPGTGGAQAWAVGHLTAKLPGWDTESPSGQLVFLKYGSRSGWEMAGPPTDGSNAAINPVVSQIALGSSGEGWAVGPGGTILHHTPGGGWVSKGCPQVTCSDLYALSLREQGGALTGYAVGQGSTVLRLTNGSWSPDDRPVITSSGTIDLYGVVANPGADAWAVGQSSSRDLQIYRREAAGWNRQLTGKPLFDNPFPGSTDQGAVNLAALGTSIGASPDGSVVWVGGGFYPVDSGSALEDAERPFTMRWRSSDGRYTSYCPRLYSLSNDQASTEDICDEPMPFSPFNITSFSVLSPGEVLAGGMGLFHFKQDRWFREPDAVGYVSSVSFASDNEGWVTTTGNTIGVGGAARSSSLTVGHYTARPTQPRVARWPQPNRNVLRGVAVSRDGTRGIAAGEDGALLIFEPGAGWDKLQRRTFNDFNAVAYNGKDEAWAVGNTGLISRIRGRDVQVPFDQGMLGGEALFSVAFSEGRGYAVGAGGKILSFLGGAWKHDPASGKVTGNSLYSISPVGAGFVAVGKEGTVLLNASGAPGDWSIDRSMVPLIQLPRVKTPDLFSVQGLGDGTILAAGSRGALIKKDPAGTWSRATAPIDGDHSVIEAKGFRDSAGNLRVFASVSPDLNKFQGDELGTSQAWIMYFDGSKWIDIDHSHRRTMYGKTDLGASSDPALSIAVDDAGRAWGVGGIQVNLPDQDGHLNTTPSGSVYRIDVAGDPRPKDTRITPQLPEKGFNFAVMGETGCGTGLCSVAVGSGITADTVPLAVQEEVNALSRAKAGPKFLLHGGDMRAIGLPEEIGQFAGFLSDFDVPVFASMGPKDVFSASPGSINTPPGLADAYRRAIDTPAASPANRFYLRQFAGELEPWGTSGAEDQRFIPVEILKSPEPGMARTYYAFDYAPAGRPEVRFVVLDTSDKSFSKTAVQQVTQNPPLQDQATWFNAVITDAFNNTPPLPTIVLMSTPTVNPTTPVENDRIGMLTDGVSFETNASGSLGVSAVLTALVHSNSVYYVPSELAPNRVPFYVLGGGGAPLEGTKEPLDGFYHAWQLINVDTEGVDLLNPQAKVTVNTFPVLESVALHAVKGRFVPGGNALLFEGLGRGVDGGGPPGDADQSKRTYISFPVADRCTDNGPFYGSCLASSTLKPDYHFYSDDPSIATFVVRDPAFADRPLVENGHLVADDQSGFLCTFKAGTTHVNLVSGTHRARMPITVGAGTGPCVKHPVLGLPKVPAVPIAPVIDPVAPAPGRLIFNPPPVPEPIVVVLPPAPGPIAAPAPPASAAGARKEEEEAQHEQQGQDDDAEFRALPVSAYRRTEFPVNGWLLVVTATLMGAMGAIAAGGLRRNRPDPIYARWRN